MTKTPPKILGFFQLVMINVIAVDSIRSLTFSAVYGYSLVFFYLLAALTFFIPTALVSAELGAALPTKGGIYIWVREAFGKKWSLFVIWLNWIYNVIWYPTIMALIAGTLTYFFNPALAENPYYMSITVIVLFWTATIINTFGMKASSIFSTIGALVGTIFPMILISILGMLWLFSGNPSQINFSLHDFFPHESQTNNIAFLTNVLFGLLGLEMTATHASEMKNPTKDYPKSLLVSCIIILLTIIFGSLAIAIVVPHEKLSLVTGVMQAFKIFAESYNLPWLTPMLAGCIILGGLSGVGAWIIGPTKGLQVATHDKSLPSFLALSHKHEIPTVILIIQAVIVSILCLLFIYLPSINSSYWLLSAMTAQLALIVYIILFAAALKLFYSKSIYRHFKIPGKKIGMWLVCSLGSISSFLVILFGFIPPKSLTYQSVFFYELTLFGGMISLCLVPLILFWIKDAMRSKKNI